MKLMSPDFEQGNPIPKRFSCEGENISPAFSWQNAPKETKSFAFILHDPDAQKANGYTHWLIYNIPPAVSEIPQNVPKQDVVPMLGIQGKNDSGKVGYTGPCPPSGTHRYFARLYSLKTELQLHPGFTLEDIKAAMNGNIIEETELMGTYIKAQSAKA